MRSGPRRPGRLRGVGPAAGTELVLSLLTLAVVWWVGLRQGFLADVSITDVPVFADYAEAMRDGRLPYRDFFFEYPPLAAPLIWLAGARGTAYETYFESFGALMFATALGLLVLTAALAHRAGLSASRRRLALALAACAPLLLGSLVRTHFDYVPLLACGGALLAMATGRSRTAFGLVGIGALVKLFPLLLAPAFAAGLVSRGRGREAMASLAVLGGVLVLGYGAAFALSPSGAWDSLSFHAERPVQIESLPASLALAADRLGVADARVTGTTANPDRFRSQGIEGAGAEQLAALGVIVLLAVLAWSAATLLPRTGCAGHNPGGSGENVEPDRRLGDRTRGPEHDLIVACALALTALAALGKVLSPQYMVWSLALVPLAAAVAPLRVGLPWVAALALTQAGFPHRYDDLLAQRDPALAILWARNLALLALVGGLLALLVRPRPEAAPARSSRPARRA